MTFTSPPRSTPPHWSHWPPVTPPPPPIPFLNPMTLSPASLSPSLQWLLSSLLPPPPRFRSATAPVSSLFRSAPTIFGGPVSPPVVPCPHRGTESAALQRIARPYSVSGGLMSSLSQSPRPLLLPPGGGTATSRPSLCVAFSPQYMPIYFC